MRPESHLLLTTIKYFHMKKTSHVLILLILFAAVSCSKKSEDTPTPDPVPTPVTPTYFMTYKFNGTLITADSLSVNRTTISGTEMLTITGMKKASPHFPVVQMILTESFIGWSDGLNVGCNSAAAPDWMITMNDAAGIGYSTETSSSGINLFFSKLSYTQGNVIKGTFSGEIIKNSTSLVTPITEGTFSMLISN